MRLRHPGGRIVHLSSGLHTRGTRDLPSVVERLDVQASAIRTRLGIDTLGVSLWLAPVLAAALAVDGRSRTRLCAELDARGLEVVTLSGVPQAGGGGENLPDWSDPDRLEYTLDLARVLVDLLPEDAVRGAVTTLGFGRRAGWDQAKQRENARILGRLSAGLAEVAWHTGRAVRVGFQPEPGHVLDSAADIVSALSQVDSDRIGVSLDLAALACTWQDPVEVLDQLAGAGISIIRVRIAAALQVTHPVAAAGALHRWVEPDRPNQVTTPAGGYAGDLAPALGNLTPALGDLAPALGDLAPALGNLTPVTGDLAAGLALPPGPWRVNCHVPLHTDPEPPLTATGDVWRAAVRHLMSGPLPATEYLDVETRSAAEIEYVSGQLSALGMTPPAKARTAH